MGAGCSPHSVGAVVTIGYRAGNPGEDALALGGVLSDVLGTESHPHTCKANSARTVAAELADVSRDERAELLVLGSSSRLGFGRVVFGDVATTLLHEAPCALAVAPAGYAESDPGPPLRIAVAFDGGPESGIALRTAIELADRTRARLSVLTAIDAVGSGLSGPFSMMGAAQTVEVHREAMRHILDLALEQVPAELPVDARLLLGPADEIAEAACNDDLLITGSHGRGPLGRAMLGSVSARLLAKAECPVLALPGRLGPDPLRVLGSTTAIA